MKKQIQLFKMKHSINLLIMVFAVLFSGYSNAQTNSQEISEAQILEKCLDITDLQQHLAKNSAGSFLPVHIMQYPISFSNNLNLSKFNEPVVFLSRQEITSNNDKSFFIFKVISIDGDKAQVEFDYYNNTQETQLFETKATLNKTASGWEIFNFSINKK